MYGEGGGEPAEFAMLRNNLFLTQKYCQKKNIKNWGWANRDSLMAQMSHHPKMKLRIFLSQNN